MLIHGHLQGLNVPFSIVLEKYLCSVTDRTDFAFIIGIS